MKKKLFVLLMLVAIAAITLTACGGSKDDGISDESTSNEETLSDETFGDETFGDETFGDETSDEETTNYYSVQIRSLDEAILIVTSTDGDGGKVVEEVGSYGWIGSSGMTIGQMMEEWEVESIEPSCEGYDFLGWIAFETGVEVDEDGFEDYIENELFDGKLFTTEEMMSQELIDSDICFYTVWDLVCDECGEHKVCNAYYFDDDRYFICDDCYPEFEPES